MVEARGRLAEKVVLITGTGGGQGRAAARLFAREGATVVGADLDEADNARTADLVAADGFTLDASAPVDFADPRASREWVEAARDRHGRIDVLYNNASAPRFEPFGEMSEEDFRFTVRNEIDVVWFPAQAVWPILVQQGGGVIINVGSVSGMVGDREFTQAAHTLTKGAVIAWTRQLAAEGARHGIRANSVSPGAIASPPVQAWLDRDGDRAPVANMIRHTFDGSPGQPEDPVRMALFLASDEARWVTGQNFVVDGGTSVFL